MSAIIGTLVILALAWLVAWLIRTLPLEAMTKRIVMAVLGVIVLLWLVKVLVVGGPFTWRP
jgi:hypothetical protein